MKNLKKLSAAFMLAALLSSSLTSCIDNEVSPLVEAIYAGQADLLAAQATVQTAEAALLNAQAQAEQALASYREAEAARLLALANQIDAATADTTAANAQALLDAQEDLRRLIADNDNAIATAQLALDLAQAQFDVDMAALLADLAEAGAAEAAGYAASYAAYMTKVNTSATAILGLQGDIAEKNLLLAAGGLVTWEYYLNSLDDDLAAYNAAVVALGAEIAGYEAAVENPSDREAQHASLVEQIAVLDADQSELAIQIAEAEQARLEANTALNDATAFMTDPTGAYFIAEDGVQTWAAAYTADSLAVTVAEGLITTYTTAMNDWAGTKTTLEAAETAADAAEATADDAVTAAIAALGTVTAAPSAGDAAIDPSTSLYDDLYNAQLVAADKALELSDMQTAFAALTATYNAAAVTLAAEQVAFDGNTYQDDLDTANDALTVADAALTTALADYASAKTAFEADTTGSVTTDGTGSAIDDLGELGLDDDLATKTYMRVATWTETSLGSGQYVPATLESTKYTLADLPVAIQALKDDVVSPNFLTADAHFIIWEQDGSGLQGDLATPATLPAGGTFLTAGEVVNTVSQLGDVEIDAAYFLEVESDDTSVTNLYTFNVATNMLGLEDFSGRDLVVSGTGATTVWEAVLAVPADTSAGYDTVPNSDGEADTAVNALTAYAALWNAQLEVAKKELALDLGDDLLIAAQAAFDAQKELFDNGVANIAALEVEVTTANDGVTTAGDDITAAVAALGTVITTGSGVGGAAAVGDTAVDAEDNAPTDSLTLYEVLFNAEIAALDAADALATHEATDEDAYQAMIDAQNVIIADSTLEMVEDLILKANFEAEQAELQAEYDALLLTPLYAALTVALDDAADAKAALEAAKTASEAMETSLNAVKTAIEIDLFDYAAAIATAETALATAIENVELTEVLIAKGELDLQDVMDAIDNCNAQIAVLEAQMAIDQSLADEYKALLDAALAS